MGKPAKRKVASKRPKGPYPLIDETQMLDLLSGAKGPEKTQAGAFLAVLDTFDRKLSRQTFFDILQRSIWLHTWLGSLSTFNSIVKLHEEKRFDEAAIANARAEFIASTEKMRASLVNTMREVATCAPSDATLH